jgi:hypothetical protein
MGDQKLDLARTSRGKFKKCDGHFWHSKTPLKIITTSNSFWTRDDMMMIPIASLVAKMQAFKRLFDARSEDRRAKKERYFEKFVREFLEEGIVSRRSCHRPAMTPKVLSNISLL